MQITYGYNFHVDLKYQFVKVAGFFQIFITFDMVEKLKIFLHKKKN